MSRLLVRFAVLTLGGAALAAPSAAQVPLVPGALAIGAGVELPQGTGADMFKPGYTASLGYRIGIPLLPFAVRVEAGASRFDPNGSGRIDGVTVTATGATNVLSGGGAVEMTVLPLIVARVYAVGGAAYTRAMGDFRTGTTAAATLTNAGLGYSAGVGAEIRLPFVPTAGVEARYKVAPNVLAGRGNLTSISVMGRITF